MREQHGDLIPIHNFIYMKRPRQTATDRRNRTQYGYATNNTHRRYVDGTCSYRLCGCD